MSAPELKPCPFCGTSAHLHTKMLDERFGYANESKVKCQGCGVAFSFLDDQNPKGGYALNGTGQVKAIAAWNRRAPAVLAELPEVKALIAAARNDALREAAELHDVRAEKLLAEMSGMWTGSAVSKRLEHRRYECIQRGEDIRALIQEAPK